MSDTQIDLLRHGECEGASAIYRGIIDVPLSEQGWQTMSSSVDTLALADASSSSWDIIITSPKQRCKRFASTLAEKLCLPLEVNAGFQEINFGRWEGLTFSEVWSAESDNVKAFYSDPESNPHQGESVSEMTLRVMAAWQSLLKTHQGKRVLVVNHGGIIRVLLSELLSIPMSSVSKMDVPYGCLTRFKVFSDKEEFHPMLQFHNRSGY